jgi:hypothetical protein
MINLTAKFLYLSNTYKKNVLYRINLTLIPIFPRDQGLGKGRDPGHRDPYSQFQNPYRKVVIPSRWIFFTSSCSLDRHQ